MNIKQFQSQYGSLKSTEALDIKKCDHRQCKGLRKPIKQIALKKNILKSGGNEFICRDCMMKFKNPMQQKGRPSRQTDEIISVLCPDPKHVGEPTRQMKMSCYYGSMEQPYQQICGSCSQKGHEVSQETRDKLSEALVGRELSEEHKEKIRTYMKTNTEGIARGKKNLISGFSSGWNTGQTTPDEVKHKISAGNKGKKRTLKQRLAVSEGRKLMLKETGGFTREHRERISEATVRQYELGFNPKLYHLRGWHKSPKMFNPVFFRSSYEKKAYMLLDDDPSVKSYKAESLRVKYFHPIKEITSTYLIDLEITFNDNSLLYVEIKPEKLVSKPVTAAKIEAAKAAITLPKFEVWTETKLFGDDWEPKVRAFAKELKKQGVEYGKVKKAPGYSVLNPVPQEFQKVISDQVKDFVVIESEVQMFEDGLIAWLAVERQSQRQLKIILIDCVDHKWYSHEVDEIEGPYATSCPLRLLDLTEIGNLHKNDLWRKALRNII